MASSDALPIPRKNAAYRITFPILDDAGDLVAGATSLDSEVSKDAGTFADCTNEATQIATNSGIYYLDLTSTEMNADTVAVIVKSSEGKTVPIVLYPQEGTDIRVNTTAISDDTVAADNAELFYEGAFVAGNVDDAGPSAGSFAGNAGLSSTDDFYIGSALAFTSGDLAGVARRVSDYTGSSNTFTFNTAFPTSPADQDTFIIIGRIE
jgi:hypothetical protein